MRHLAVAPIIHYQIYKTYNLEKETEVKEEEVVRLCEKNKSIIEETQNEQIFINEVVKQYGDFLSSDQSKAG